MTYQPAAVPHEPYYAPGWGAPAPRPRTDGLAVASFVTAVVGLGLVGIGLGLGALVRIRRGVRQGRGLALAGIAIGVVWTVVEVVVVVGLVSAALANRPLSLAVDGPRDAYATQLVTGHCLADLPADEAVGRVPVVPCDEPHAAQVVSEFRFAPDAIWPGQDDADALVAAGCELSTGELEAGLGAVTWAPTPGTWEDGDRTGLCVAHRDAPFTGSLLDGSADLG
ncbi:DUF4190 domain-containing protein [Cellulomonas aerilata]|uniref:DUF4190 domain-containing protein n=1 Tax=Cellulomonas aerilata TaxID=515326 RepID=A0A512D739_9CELL|nr:DUF4190 domain-containing protein [Cellulomonas aerilata]GEO32298.1 hypothetical protein CAE01nite_00230 [Cellulomonas aerilata]